MTVTTADAPEHMVLPDAPETLHRAALFDSLTRAYDRNNRTAVVLACAGAALTLATLLGLRLGDWPAYAGYGLAGLLMAASFIASHTATAAKKQSELYHAVRRTLLPPHVEHWAYGLLLAYDKNLYFRADGVNVEDLTQLMESLEAAFDDAFRQNYARCAENCDTMAKACLMDHVDLEEAVQQLTRLHAQATGRLAA